MTEHERKEMEEAAEKYAEEKQSFDDYDGESNFVSIKVAYLAGYKDAMERCEERIEELTKCPLEEWECKKIQRRLERKLAEAVEVINAVQCTISVLCNGDSFVGNTAREAWNFNCRFLNDNFQLQNEYLEKVNAGFKLNRGNER